MDIAGAAYWERHWRHTAVATFRPDSGRLRDYRDRVLADLLATATDGLAPGALILEAGCADSVLLPYLATKGFSIAGVDYSQAGCEKVRAQLGDVSADIECCDIFDPPARLVGIADLVISYGLVEHFEDTAASINACASFIKPGGRMLTIVPNMCGTLGFMQKRLAPSIYKAHVPLTCEALRRAHAALEVKTASYLMPMGYGVLDCREPGVGGAKHLAKRIALSTLSRLSWCAWAVDRHIHLPVSEALSPYAFCIALKHRAQ